MRVGQRPGLRAVDGAESRWWWRLLTATLALPSFLGVSLGWGLLLAPADETEQRRRRVLDGAVTNPAPRPRVAATAQAAVA